MEREKPEGAGFNGTTRPSGAGARSKKPRGGVTTPPSSPERAPAPPPNHTSQLNPTRPRVRKRNQWGGPPARWSESTRRGGARASRDPQDLLALLLIWRRRRREEEGDGWGGREEQAGVRRVPRFSRFGREFSGIQSPGERFCAAAAVISLYLSLVSARRGSCEPELGEKVWSYTR